MEHKVNCPICGTEEEYGQMYEYRGALSCADCFEIMQIKRDNERMEIINEEKHKTNRFSNLDLSNSIVGKANREILKVDIEIAKKESARIKKYEDRK